MPNVSSETTDTLAHYIEQLGQRAAMASQSLAQLTTAQKNKTLQAMATALLDHKIAILDANKKDERAATEAGLSTSLKDRLHLDIARITAMARGITNISQLPDPVGQIIDRRTLSNGLRLHKITTPIGVIGVIYESRPNVTADVAALCLKAGNAVILRGGREAYHSNQAIYTALIDGVRTVPECPTEAIQWVQEVDRICVQYLVQLDRYVDLIIPRGGEALIQAVCRHATVPIIKHDKGVCHLYIDAQANLKQAIQIALNAKCQRPGVCNAIETILIHETCAPHVLPALADALMAEGVVIRGDERVYQTLHPTSSPDNPRIQRATDADWSQEYLDLMIAIKVVPSIEAAIQHINHYGSHHSDAIITTNLTAQQQFRAGVDSAVVYINASTRFTDGAEFDMGAEIGISTNKLHARGPMGLAELTTYKYIIEGQGQCRT